MELAFKKDKSERVLNFKEICSFTQTDENDIERLTMRAMRLGLISG